MPTKEQQIQFDQFAEVMDKRDAFFQELNTFELKHGFLPEILPDGKIIKGDCKLMNAYAEWKRCGGWRKMPGVIKKLWKAAKKQVTSGEKISIKKVAEKVNESIFKNTKEKKLYKKDFGDDWPFVANEVLLRQREGNCVTVVIDNTEYAVNGMANERLNLDFPNNHNKILRDRYYNIVPMYKSVGAIIQMGLSL